MTFSHEKLFKLFKLLIIYRNTWRFFLVWLTKSLFKLLFTRTITFNWFIHLSILLIIQAQVTIIQSIISLTIIIMSCWDAWDKCVVVINNCCRYYLSWFSIIPSHFDIMVKHVLKYILFFIIKILTTLKFNLMNPEPY